MPSLNRFNLDKLAATLEKVKKNPAEARKVNRIEGEWLLSESEAQFRSEVTTEKGRFLIESDQPGFFGGNGSRPSPMQYCLYGVASCYAATFAGIAAEKGIELKRLKVVAEANMDLSRPLGLSENPVVEQVKFTVLCEANAGEEKISEIKKLAEKRCPAVFCLTNPIKLSVELAKR